MQATPTAGNKQERGRWREAGGEAGMRRSGVWWKAGGKWETRSQGWGRSGGWGARSWEYGQDAQCIAELCLDPSKRVIPHSPRLVPNSSFQSVLCRKPFWTLGVGTASPITHHSSMVIAGDKSTCPCLTLCSPVQEQRLSSVTYCVPPRIQSGTKPKVGNKGWGMERWSSS